MELIIIRGGIFACGIFAVAGSFGGMLVKTSVEVPLEEIGTAGCCSMLRALMSEALMSEVLMMEVGRAAFPPSGAGDFAAGDSGVVRGNISFQEISRGKPGSRMGPISLIIGKGPINGGGPDGGATWPVRCLLAGGGSDFGATLPAEKVSWYLPGLGHGRVGIGAVGIAFGGGREGGVGSVSAVARIFSRWLTVVGFSHINPAVRRSRRSTMASLGIAHCVVTAKLRLW